MEIEQLVSSTFNAPTPSRPKRSDLMDEPDLKGLKVNGIPRSGTDTVAHLEAQVNGFQIASES